MEQDSKKEARLNVLSTYINDMVAVERDISQALKGQQEDSDVATMPEVHRLIEMAAESAVARHDVLVQCAKDLDGKAGAAVKDAVMAAAGSLAGLFAKLRKHPVSKMLRDDITALNLAATAYSMLYTTAVAFDEEEMSAVALEHLNTLPEQIMEMTRLLPGVVVEELEKEHGPVNEEAAELATEAIQQAWEAEELV